MFHNVFSVCIVLCRTVLWLANIELQNILKKSSVVWYWQFPGTYLVPDEYSEHISQENQ